MVNQGIGPAVDITKWYPTDKPDLNACGRYFPTKFVDGKRNDITISGSENYYSMNGYHKGLRRSSL